MSSTTVTRITEPKRPSSLILQKYPVAAGAHIIHGAIVCKNSSGYAVDGADTSGLECLGIADAEVDNTLGSNGDLFAPVLRGVFRLPCTSITQAMLLDPLYVVDNQTLDDDAGSTNKVCAGYLEEFISTTECWAYIGPMTIPFSGVTASAAELNKLDGIAAGGYMPVAHEVTFTETAGAGTYTGSVAVPAGATLLDIIVNGVALWDNDGAVAMDVGDVADPNGYFASIDLKATDLLAGESISFAQAGGKAGAYIANSQVSPRYSASARTISGIIVSASTGGSAGRTRMVVVYVLPTPTAATKA